MHSMQRQIGKLRHKGAGDNAKVAMLLNDYEDADRVLAKVKRTQTSEIRNCHLLGGDTLQSKTPKDKANNFVPNRSSSKPSHGAIRGPA